MESNAGAATQPTVPLGLMSAQIVQNHMYVLVGMGSHQFVHEVQEFAAAPAVVVSGLHQSGGYIQCRKQGGRPMALVAMAVAVEGFPVGQA